MKTESTAEAMALLKKYRYKLINEARVIGDELIRKNGSTNTREVYDIMSSRGLLDGNVNNFWLGAVFRENDKYHWTGDWVDGATGPNIHAPRKIKVWEFA